MLLNSAPLAGGWEKLLTAIRNQSSVPPSLRELMILRVAVINRASFEYHEHLPPARKAGLSETKIEAVRTWGLPEPFEATAAEASNYDIFDADEQLVLSSPMP